MAEVLAAAVIVSVAGVILMVAAKLIFGGDIFN